MDDIRKQNDSLAAQLEAAEQRKKDAERKRITLVRVLDEACLSLPHFDIQLVEEPEQRIARLKDYAQQPRRKIEKLKAEHETQIAELQLRIPPESPPKAKEQRRADIQASAEKISNIVGSVAKLLEDSVETWTTLQEHPRIGQLQETIRQWQTELNAVKEAIKTLPPMEKMLKVKRSNELQHEIELCRAKATEVENSMQPLLVIRGRLVGTILLGKN